MKYDDLRHKEVFWGDTEEITGIDISLEGTDYSLTSKGKKGDRTWMYQEEEIEADELTLCSGRLKSRPLYRRGARTKGGNPPHSPSG